MRLSVSPCPRLFEEVFTFNIKFSEATIIDGGIQFSKKIEVVELALDFIVYNTALKASYEPVKPYFEKRLKRKTFSVRAKIRVVEGKIAEKTAESEVITSIDETFIRTIQRSQIASLPKIGGKEDKTLYSLDELQDESNGLEGNIFKITIDDIIKELAPRQHRNSKQLSFLSDQHSEQEEPIYLTLAKYFGFVFCVVTETRRFYFWELFNSHATYIWRFHRTSVSKAEAFREVDTAIKEIYRIGRNAYKDQHRYAPDDRYLFGTIEHLGDGERAVPVFEEWLKQWKAVVGIV